MLDPKTFDVTKLIEALLSTPHERAWQRRATIQTGYMPPHPGPKTRPSCVVRFGEDWFLRYSKGPHQCHFWDMYGDDYLTPELALVALLQAPPPPCLVVDAKVKPYVEVSIPLNRREP